MQCQRRSDCSIRCDLALISKRHLLSIERERNKKKEIKKRERGGRERETICNRVVSLKKAVCTRKSKPICSVFLLLVCEFFYGTSVTS